MAKGNDCGKGDFYEVCKDCVQIGGQAQKILKESCIAMKVKNGKCRGGSKREKISAIRVSNDSEKMQHV